MIRSRLPLVALFAVAAATTPAGIARHRSRGHRPHGRRVHRLLRLRERRLARAAPDPGLHGSLEQALGIGRDQQGARARHPRPSSPRASRLADGQRRAADRRLLRRLHGRNAGQRARRQAGAAAARRDPRDQDARRRAAHDRRTCTTSASRCRSASSRSRTCTTRRSVIAHIDAGGLGMPDRDYYLKTEQALRRGAREVPRRTSRRCSSSPARSRPQAKQDAGDRVRVREAPRRSLARQRRAARSEASGPQDDVRRAAEARAGLRLGRVLRRREACRTATST